MGHGLCHDLLDRLILEHSVLLGEPVHEELHRILTRKFRVPSSLWRELDSRLCEFEQAPAVPGLQVDASIKDADDIAVLASAVAASADLIVTGDNELLDIGSVEKIRIVSPRQCWMMTA